MKKLLLAVISLLPLISSGQDAWQTHNQKAQSGAIIDTVMPHYVTQGDTVVLTIKGKATHFLQGIDPKLYNSNSPYYFMPINYSALDDSTAQVRFFFHYGLVPDFFTLYLYCPGDGTMYLDSAVQLLPGTYPPSFIINPNSCYQSQTVNCTIQGTNTHFLQSNLGIYGINLKSVAGNYYITPDSVAYINDSLMTATFSTTYTTYAGVYNVQINTWSPTPPLTLTNGFTVNVGPYVPALTSISPSTSSQGSAVSVQINATNTHFTAGTNTVTIGSYTAGSINVVNDSRKALGSCMPGPKFVDGTYTV